MSYKEQILGFLKMKTSEEWENIGFQSISSKKLKEHVGSREVGGEGEKGKWTFLGRKKATSQISDDSFLWNY